MADGVAKIYISVVCVPALLSKRSARHANTLVGGGVSLFEFVLSLPVSSGEMTEQASRACCGLL